MTQPLLTFVHMSDTHLPGRTGFTTDGRPHAHANTRAVIAQINALPFPVEFVMLAGDVAHDPAHETDYLTAKATLSQLNPKLYVVPGNHDRPKWLHHVVMGRVPDTYYYEFESRGVQFICLDSSVPRSHHGKLSDDQLAWLDQLVTVPSNKPLIVVLHHHPVPVGGAALDGLRLVNGDALHQILLKARHRLRCVLFGHIHESVTIIRDGITYASTQSTWFQSRSWHGQQEFGDDVIHTPGFNVVTLLSTGETFIRAYRAPV